MPMRETGPGTVHEIDARAGGAGWIAHPEEGMQRASHAVVADGDVWVVDPVDAEGLDEFLAELGTVAGVVVLLDRHKRDCARLARRHDVAVHVPRVMADIAGDFDAETTMVDGSLPGTPFALKTVVDSTVVPVEPFRWREVAIHHPDWGTLLVPESLGTVSYMRTGEERLGVHPMRRFTPPRSLATFEPEIVLVGHGPGIHEDAAAAVRTAVEGARRRAPGLYLRTIRGAIAD